jgi:hypothetical protein
MSWIWLIVTFLLGGFGGYILKDQLTEEYVSNVTMNKPKVKGRGNKLDADQVTEVNLKKLSWKERRAKRKAQK